MTEVVERYTESGGDGGYMFECPGCKSTHAVPIGQGQGPRWGFNGSADKPTFTPSILARSGHYAPGHDGGKCWCTWAKDHPEEAEDGFKCGVCHSFVTDGRIQFLGDCTHALAGQTVDLPPIPEGDA